MQVICKKFIRRFCVIMRPVQVPQATASPIEMKLAVKVSQYLFSPVKVVICSVMPPLGLINA